MKQKQTKLKVESKKLKVLVVATLFTFSLLTVTAQESVNATGGNATGIGGSASYSVGQVVYTNHSGSNGSVAEGVQLPYEISVVTSTENFLWKNITCEVYPNPASKYLTLNIKNNIDLSKVEYRLFDANGRLLKAGKVLSSNTEIEMQNYPASIYFLKVFSNKKELKFFKIVKN